MNKKTKLTIISSIIAFVFVLVGGTLAYLQWATNETQRTNVFFTVQNSFSCGADGGGNITQNDATLIPTSCTNSPYVIKRKITTDVVSFSNSTVSLDLWLDIKNISTELSNSQYFSYALTDSSSGCNSGNWLSSGTFYGKNNTTNNRVDLVINDQYTSTGQKTYYLYIWLDTAETNNATQNQQFNLELDGECYIKDEVDTPNAPDIVDGLIPVKLSIDGSIVTTVAENDSTWYDYDNKKWANAVLVNEDTHTRSYYESNPGTVVPESDILAYYVWIPRYSYPVWILTGVSSNSDNHSIDIKFIPQSSTDSLEDVSAIGDYYTPPGFWWDSNNNGNREQGEELSGIWVGKFETSHKTLSSSVDRNNLGVDTGEIICNSNQCNYYSDITILPNKVALRYNRLSNFFNTSKLMISNGNPFGLNSTSISHVIKNSEWGAVAYLSRSKYGKNSEVSSNINADYITADNLYGSMKNGNYTQSTTGNVTGVFDMAGGSIEYVMGHFGDATVYGSNTGFSSNYPLPYSQYYDNYPSSQFDGTSGQNKSKCTLEYCGGHALFETASWYGDSFGFISSGAPWFVRGGENSDSSIVGIFYSSFPNLTRYFDYGSRYALIKKLDTDR